MEDENRACVTTEGQNPEQRERDRQCRGRARELAEMMRTCAGATRKNAQSRDEPEPESKRGTELITEGRDTGKTIPDRQGTE